MDVRHFHDHSNFIFLSLSIHQMNDEMPWNARPKRYCIWLLLRVSIFHWYPNNSCESGAFRCSAPADSRNRRKRGSWKKQQCHNITTMQTGTFHVRRRIYKPWVCDMLFCVYRVFCRLLPKPWPIFIDISVRKLIDSYTIQPDGVEPTQISSIETAR